ncbi:MAG TPA: hypothetical protein VFU13_13520 [Steroidobacteraceae bacterium]|nr:hypothetical protein [Steroidobacteraceae bacterium]
MVLPGPRLESREHFADIAGTRQALQRGGGVERCAAVVQRIAGSVRIDAPMMQLADEPQGSGFHQLIEAVRGKGLAACRIDRRQQGREIFARKPEILDATQDAEHFLRRPGQLPVPCPAKGSAGLRRGRQ